MESTRRQLIAHLLGDLSPEESAGLEQRLEADAGLRSEHEALSRRLSVIRNLPVEDAPDSVVDSLLTAASEHLHAEKPAPVISLWPRVGVLLSRVAAVLVVAGLVVLAVMFTPDGPPPVVATVYDGDAPARHVGDSELIEAPIGSQLRVTFAAGELLVDGGSALRLHRTGADTPPRIEVERGRVVADARDAALALTVGGQTVALEKGAILGLDYDRQFARILDAGAVVEIQRTPIEEVLLLARQTYGVNLTDHGLPDTVRRMRVTFSGTGLDAPGFLESFGSAAAQYGVVVSHEGEYVSYVAGMPHRVGRAEEPEVLSLTMLAGGAELRDADGVHRLHEAAATLVLLPGRAEPSAEPLERAVIWARGMGNAHLDARLADVRTGPARLPAGAVIYPDRLVLPEGDERIFVLDGPEFSFPLPGGRMGRLVDLLASGAVFEAATDGDKPVERVFVPFSRVVRD
jgi:hypothetical protein